MGNQSEESQEHLQIEAVEIGAWNNTIPNKETFTEITKTLTEEEKASFSFDFEPNLAERMEKSEIDLHMRRLLSAMDKENEYPLAGNNPDTRRFQMIKLISLLSKELLGRWG